jgi:hypothetical protein
MDIYTLLAVLGHLTIAEANRLILALYCAGELTSSEAFYCAGSCGITLDI